jgi:hypothetical protein
MIAWKEGVFDGMVRKGIEHWDLYEFGRKMGKKLARHGNFHYYV